jgi:hypothetical protein
MPVSKTGKLKGTKTLHGGDVHVSRDKAQSSSKDMEEPDMETVWVSYKHVQVS